MNDTTDHRAEAGRPRWWVAGLSLFLLIASGLVAWRLTDDDVYVAPPPSPPAHSVSPGLAAQTLTRFQKAVDAGDLDAARALAPADDPAAAALLAAVVRNADTLRVADFTLRYVDAEGALGEDGDWSAAVDATWRFAGFDRAPARAEITVELREEGEGVALTGFGGGDRVSPLWLSGPLQVRRTARTLVLVDGSPADASRYEHRAAAAVPVVRRVLPDWDRGLVVEVPDSVEELNRALDADPGTYDQIAAVTTSPDGTTSADASVHVFVNPDVYTGLRPTGAQVVMSHEATHVAADAWTSQMPLWLLEGFADYVALRDVDLPVSRSAAQIIAEVRRGRAPRALPGAAEFGTRATHLGAAYESAWLACRLLAQVGGEADLVRFYRDVDRGRPVGSALEATFGLTTRELTARWRDLLADLALPQSTR